MLLLACTFARNARLSLQWLLLRRRNTRPYGPCCSTATACPVDRTAADAISFTLVLSSQVQLHTTFHYPPTPPVEGDGCSADKLHVVADTALALADAAAMHDVKAAVLQGPSPQTQQFHSLPTPPTPELSVASLQQQMTGGELVSGSSSHSCQPAADTPAYGAEPSKQQLYQWQATNSNFCVMGPSQFAAPTQAAAFPARRPPPLYYQATSEKTSAVASQAQSGPLRSPMSEFVVMKECIDGELLVCILSPLFVYISSYDSFPTEIAKTGWSAPLYAK